MSYFNNLLLIAPQEAEAQAQGGDPAPLPHLGLLLGEASGTNQALEGAAAGSGAASGALDVAKPIAGEAVIERAGQRSARGRKDARRSCCWHRHGLGRPGTDESPRR